MSSFAVFTYALTVQAHPDADRLDIVRPDGTLYIAVAQKGRFRHGDRAVYVPEGAVVPERVLRATGFWDDEHGKGMLAGPAGDRVKAIKLRGVLSQGILLGLDDAAALLTAGADGPVNGDWGPALGITKYQPPIPREMSGQAYHQPGLRGYTDIENVKNYPGVLVDGELVHITEKLHGSCTVVSLLRDDTDWRLHVSSKGMSSKALALQESERNVYWRAARALEMEKVLAALAGRLGAEREVTVFGETLGVQDLMYGLSGGQVAFRAFDVRVDGRWLDAAEAEALLAAAGVPMVPVLYRGPYSAQLAWELASGKTEAMAGQQGKHHIREGVVVRPACECDDMKLGRVILKFVSDAYLTRKGNATEME